MPVNLHTKGAEKEVFNLLPSYNLPGINIHWYSGPEVYLTQGTERGYYFSITPAIEYSPAVKKVAITVDTDHLLLESDGPVEYRGKMATPASINKVLTILSQLRGNEKDELEGKILKNTKTLFPRVFL